MTIRIRIAALATSGLVALGAFFAVAPASQAAEYQCIGILMCIPMVCNIVTKYAGANCDWVQARSIVNAGTIVYGPQSATQSVTPTIAKSNYGGGQWKAKYSATCYGGWGSAGGSWFVACSYH